jgi:predicted nucleotidyltransferase
MGEPNIILPRAAIEDFCRRYKVRRLALFGSVLRDDFRPDSDIDVLVTFQTGARVSMITLGHMQRELSALFHRPVDLVHQDGLKPLLREQVLATAREVYAA